MQCRDNLNVMNSKVVDPNNDPNKPAIRIGTAESLSLRWAEYSRPGNDPMKRAKENQDSCIVVPNYGGRSNQMLFGVYDGHGPNGAYASQFIRNKLGPAWLETEDFDTDTFSAISRACVLTNEALSTSSIDVYVSGCTGITSFLKDNHLFTANVGDSRAVLARVAGSGLVRALDLSNDHKPDRPDELERILSYGGRVYEWGVPRVWLQEIDMPGLAMSRSYGDAAAESVGVFAEPELSEVYLGANDRFVIWASDGVWEFISSQEAVDIVWENYQKGPLEAAAALVKESLLRWTEEEDVVDDITCVLAFLNFGAPATTVAVSTSTAINTHDGAGNAVSAATAACIVPVNSDGASSVTVTPPMTV